jgi:hypothetical protein
VEDIVGDSDPFAAVERALEGGVSTRSSSPHFRRACRTGSAATSPGRVEALGLPVTVVTAKQSERAVSNAR